MNKIAVEFIYFITTCMLTKKIFGETARDINQGQWRTIITPVNTNIFSILNTKEKKITITIVSILKLQ